LTLCVDLVVFDLMGTVVKDAGAMEEALKGTLTRYSIPFTDRDHRAMRGAAKEAAFQTIIERTVGAGKGSEWSRALAEEMYGTFKEKLREGYERMPAQEIPGSEATMRWLREHRVKVAATSAVDSDLTEPMLEKLGWAEGVFDCKVATQEVPAGRPAPYMIFTAMMRTSVMNVRRVAVVGDTPVDMQAGKNAGAGWVVGVLSGVGKLEALGATAHTHLIPSAADLPKLLESGGLPGPV
jgi:phosphonatase-like hydrolase